MWLPSLACVLLLGWVTPSEIQVDEIVSVTDMSAVLGGAIHLPCILQNPVDDQVALVIWFKDGATSPIYSLDARSVPQKQQATHWADERSLGGRAFFRDAGNDSHLALEHVREADAGSYRCRVDFRRSPTRNSIINVAVIVPPTNVTILNSNGTFVRDSIGPYLEGATPELKCLSIGGRPKPILSWWLDDSPISPVEGSVSDSLVEEEEKRVSSTLKLLPLTRRSLLNKVSCRATNNQQPISASVSIDMLLPPVSVRLLGENQPLSAGRQYEVACQTAGSRPAANITWWRDGVMMDGARETTSADGNVTTSVLTLVPMPDDSGRQLCCRAANLHLPALDSNVALHDCWSLLVRYSPIVSLELGSNLNGSAIREGVDVYFECIVRANPWIHKLVWRHNGRQLQSNTSAGTLLSNQTLVLQAVRRSRTGLYTCLASNEEGDSESNPFNLDVKYAPECVPGQQRVWGAARREELSVPCLVDARPAATLFRWTFNSSNGGGGAAGTPSAVRTQPGRSVATHIPVSEKDYGTLMCWAKNELGEQLHPCVFLVVPAGRPDAPHDCHVVSRTATSLHASCTRGSDGGLPPQQFTLELFSGRRLVANVTSRTAPEFTVAGLEPGTPYVLHVFSSNGKGRSINSAPLNVSTLKATQQHRRVEIVATDPPATPTLVPPPLWLLVAALTCVLLLALAAVLVAIRLRGWRFRRSRAGGSSSSNSPRGKTPPLLLGPPDDNPDVVPHKDEIDIPNPALKALQQYNIVVEARPINVDSAAQTVLYSTVNSFPMTEAVVLTPMWPADSAPAAAAVVMESLASAPRLQDAGTQTPAGDQQHKESTV